MPDEAPIFTCLACGATEPLEGTRDLPPGNWQRQMDAHHGTCQAAINLARLRLTFGEARQMPTFPDPPPVHPDPALMGSIGREAITGPQLRRGLSVFSQVLAAATVAGSPVVGFLLNTTTTKAAGMFVSGGAAVAFLIAEGLHASADRLGIAIGTALRQR